MKLDRNSYGSVALVWALTIVVYFLLIAVIKIPALSWPVCIILGIFCLFNTFFFRVPRRMAAGNEKLLTAVADGKIVVNEKVFEPLFIKGECIQLSIYMDFFDVHANFWPITGKVLDYKYYPGKHFLAFKPKASEENEHTATYMETAGGQTILFKQLAGGFARRIVCYAKPGMEVKAGDQCGIIKFGSRIDIYLPLDAKILVNIGEEVRACETVLAELS